MYSPFYYWWRLKRWMWWAALLAIRTGFVALLLLVAWQALPWVWPGADDEVRRLLASVMVTAVRSVTDCAAESPCIDGKEQPLVRVFRGSRTSP